MKRIYISLIVLSSVMLCQAQLPAEKSWEKRLGTVNPQKAEKLFREIFSGESLLTVNTTAPISIDYYLKVKQLITLAPYSDYYYYSGLLYENSTTKDSTCMYPRMLNSIADPAIKMMLVDDVVEQGKRFVDNLDSINVLRELNIGTKGNPLTMPLAKIKRAHYNYKFAHDPKYYPAHLYDKAKAYELYREAFKEFLAAKDEQGGAELEAYYVMEYYKTCEDLYKTDEERYYEQFLTDYQEIVQVCDKLLIPYYDIPDTIKNNERYPEYTLYRGYNYWTNAKKGGIIQDDGIKALFAASGAATPERLSSYYENKLKENRRDSAYLNRAINLMNENNCTQTEAFFSYCEASYAIKPTYLNCIGCAFASKKYKMRGEMIKYFLEAQKLATTDLQRGIIAFKIGDEANSLQPTDANGKILGTETPEYKEWKENIMLSYANLKQVLDYQDAFKVSPSIEIRKLPAVAAYKLGQVCYRMSAIDYSSKVCDEAIVYMNMAKEASLDYKNSAEEYITKEITPRRDRFKKRENEIKRNAKQLAEWKRQQAEQDAKKKAVEDFWNQK